MFIGPSDLQVTNFHKPGSNFIGQDVHSDLWFTSKIELAINENKSMCSISKLK